MDMTAPRAARPFDPAVAIPIRTERPHGPHLALNPGTLWAHRVTGETLTLTSRRRAGVNLQGMTGTVMVTVPELLAGYSWTGCNHRDFCCSTHDEHTIPHRGCIMR
jgi:hypothetical protein